MTDHRRFVVRVHHPSPALLRKFPDLPSVTYRVWDTKIDRMVPFGAYSDPEMADRRADREESKVSA